MLSTLHWHPRHPNTYPKPRYMQYFVCVPLHCPWESFLVQSMVRHSLVHFTTEVKYFTPLRLSLVEWKPVCKVCLTCQPPSIGTQGTPIYATTPGLWKNLSVDPHMATILHFLLSFMMLNHCKFEYQSSAFLLLLVPLNHASLLTDFFQFKSWILPFNCYAKLQNTCKGNPKNMVCCLKDF